MMTLVATQKKKESPQKRPKTERIQKQAFIDLRGGSWLRTFTYVPRDASLTREQEMTLLWSHLPQKETYIKMFGKDVALPRKQQTYGTKGYTFSGVAHSALPIPGEFQCFLDYANEVCAPYLPAGRRFNMMLVNWYENGENYIGPHKDDEKQLYLEPLTHETLVFSMSFGATRDFILRADDPNAGRDVRLALAHHDVVLMGGRCQKTHKHSVPKIANVEEARSVGPRVNITMRIFK